MIRFELSYNGNDADDHQLDFYDAAQALLGFQRSLAITTHLVLNGEVITQAPSLKNAKIFVTPPEEGSWKVWAAITTIAAGTYQLGTAPKDTPIGHLIHSAYDYIVSESLGFHVDYDKTLGQQYEQLKSKQKNLPTLNQSKFDSAIEKCNHAIKEIHRPIAGKHTAKTAVITSNINGKIERLTPILDLDTYEYIDETLEDNRKTSYEGRVSMYNANTYKGRIYAFEASRPIPFILSESARNLNNATILTDSLADGVRSKFSKGEIGVSGYKLLSKKGNLKGIRITEVERL